jgi:hypothetical protein
MLKQDLRMRGVWALSLVISVACTKPNPRSCADGVCSDPTLPFCDVDGSLQGIPETCIAVECTPGAFEACRGDQSLVCNDVGTNFDVVQCTLGCDETAGGCVVCSMNDQCNNPQPVCELSTGECRGCAADAECSSQVCDLDTGACLAESAVVYAAPAGSPSAATCTLAQPCSLERAVALVAGSLVLRLLPGDYATRLEIATSQTTLRVVATGANITDGGLFVHGDGTDVDIRNILISTNADTLFCGDTTQTVPSVLTIRDSTLDRNGSLVCSLCSCRLSNTEITSAVLGGAAAIDLRTNSSFEGDRLRMRSGLGDIRDAIFANGVNVSARLTNSSLVNLDFTFGNDDTSLPGSQFFFAYNTIVYNGADVANGDGISCVFGAGNGMRTVRFENNIIFSTDTNEPLDPTNCTFVNNVVAPFAGSLPNNTIANPKFVNAAAGDFHLQSDSPAKDSAVPSAVALDVDHDFENTARPQGPKADIGAFEFK